MDRYVLLGEDLTKLLEGYETNPFITEAQRRTWYAEGRRKAITHGMLGKDHPRALRLLQEDGYDGQPVGSLTSRSAESFWTYMENHVFPPEDDLIRLGIFLHLDLYRLLALVLKGKWEEFFAREVCGWRANVGKDLAQVFQDEKAMEEAMSRFNPDTSGLLWKLLYHANIDFKNKGKPLFDEKEAQAPIGALVEKAMEMMRGEGIRWLLHAGYTPESFDTLVQSMLLAKLNWVATDSPELEQFKRKAVEEVVIWNLGTAEEREEYWILKQTRLQLLMELDETLLMIESVRLKNARVDYEYLKIFGGLELECKEARLRCWELEQKIILKNLSPSATEEEVEQMLLEKKKELENEVARLKEKVKVASSLDQVRDIFKVTTLLLGSGKEISEKERAEYLQKCKKLLREIFLKTHPDSLKNNPVYAKLTPKQKKELAEAFAKAQEIKETELSYSAEFIESQYRTLNTLQAILDQVNAILENAGIDIDIRLEIKGETLRERLAWLKEEIDRLEGMIQAAKVQLYALLEDEDIARKRSVLGDPTIHDQLKETLKAETKKHKKRAEELEAELKKLFGR